MVSKKSPQDFQIHSMANDPQVRGPRSSPGGAAWRTAVEAAAAGGGVAARAGVGSVSRRRGRKMLGLMRPFRQVILAQERANRVITWGAAFILIMLGSEHRALPCTTDLRVLQFSRRYRRERISGGPTSRCGTPRSNASM
jgi:hypothetical protein